MMSSGHCNDNIHRRCTWPPCTCTCGHEGRVTGAEGVAEMVAQTFDEGGNFAGISGRISSETSGPTGAFAALQPGLPLTELAESRMT